ncbi:lipopolysaccharide biosynthesis protein [Virgibacillus sp. W0181]|uniref:lipopolysaccharide biosynthesis protein n=1 Tax=Virgibacillus sp. W0181 TaxID=3391581 RepID=UPI003F44D8D4
MENKQKLMRDTFIYGVANFGSAALGFLMIPLYTFYFSPSEYGLWDLVVTTSTLLMPFITFELINATYRWVLEEKDETVRATLITTGAIAVIRNMLIFTGIAAIIFFIISIPFKWEALLYINVAIGINFIQQCARGLGFNKLFAVMGILQTLIVVILNLVFILLFQLRIEAFFYSAIIAGVSMIILGWKVMGFGKYIRVRSYSKKILHSFLVYAIPIIPGAASWWIMTMSDRYMITLFLGVDFNGIYAIANKIPALLLMINTVFFLAWKDSAILSFKSEEKNSYYSTVFFHFFRLMTTSVIMLTLLTKPILALVISDAFYEAWKYIGILLVGALFHTFSLFWSAGYHGAKKTNIILITSVAGAVINVVFNLVFIHFIGLYAVALSTVFAFLTTWIIRVMSAKKYFDVSMNIKEVAFLFALIPVAIIVPFISNGVGIVFSIVIGMALFFIYNWKIVRYLVGIVTAKRRAN